MIPIRHKGLSGKRVLLALAVLAAVLTGWLYWIAASDTPDEYRRSKPGAPAVPVRVAAVDMQWENGIQLVSETLRQARPDIVLVQHLTRDSLAELATALDINGAEHRLYSELGIDARTRSGCGIISRYPLHRHRELRDGTRDTFAVAAEVVVAGRRFLLISVAIDGSNMAEQAEVLRRTTGLLHIGPLLCAGQPGITPPPGLRALGASSARGIFASDHWRISSSGGSANVAWVEVTEARSN